MERGAEIGNRAHYSKSLSNEIEGSFSIYLLLEKYINDYHMENSNGFCFILNNLGQLVFFYQLRLIFSWHKKTPYKVFIVSLSTL